MWGWKVPERVLQNFALKVDLELDFGDAVWQLDGQVGSSGSGSGLSAEQGLLTTPSVWLPGDSPQTLLAAAAGRLGQTWAVLTWSDPAFRIC